MLPEWNFDGSSTNQANSDGNTEVILKPVKLYKDKYKLISNCSSCKEYLFVLCETYNIDESPHATNSRHIAKQIFDAHLEEKPWFGLEQEYFMYINEQNNIYKEHSNGYYCGISLSNIQRKIMTEHLNYCIETGLIISGTNAEVSPCQWEFQIGPCKGIESGDQLIMARFFLERIAEKYNAYISYHPKPRHDKNGSGCHINFSTSKSRCKNGLDYIYKYIENLSKCHSEMNDVYGENNHLRLTGKHETSSFDSFTSGVGTRNTSIRIPNETHKNQCGYLEDRRPGANIDPYKATSMLFIKCINNCC
jgi:glutamine synthetase